jgi:hypothetical protein
MGMLPALRLNYAFILVPHRLFSMFSAGPTVYGSLSVSPGDSPLGYLGWPLAIRPPTFLREGGSGAESFLSQNCQGRDECRNGIVIFELQTRRPSTPDGN